MLRSAAALGMLAFLLQPAGDQVPLPAFADVTAAAGIRFKHNNGSFGKKYLPETMGSGCAFFDADGDGRQDILLVNGMNWPAQAGRPATKSVMALYRNDGNGTFTDVTERAGLAVPMYGFGVAAGDYDNDGRTDLYVTALGANRLFRNLGGLRFEDVTAKTAVGDPGFSTSAAWLDYDRDGRLDLFVANYVEWTIEKD
ncbi:MAG: FG-GAP repeat domain-containing protein, partial [Vicinamibacterales bacterium]